jgi:hypothetical protein
VATGNRPVEQRRGRRRAGKLLDGADRGGHELRSDGRYSDSDLGLVGTRPLQPPTRGSNESLTASGRGESPVDRPRLQTIVGLAPACGPILPRPARPGEKGPFFSSHVKGVPSNDHGASNGSVGTKGGPCRPNRAEGSGALQRPPMVRRHASEPFCLARYLLSRRHQTFRPYFCASRPGTSVSAS